MLIRAVEASSPAESLGIREGEKLLSINGAEIRDVIDYHFQVADGDLEIVVESESGEQRTLEVSLDPDEDLGLTIEEMKVRLCSNECVFCFVDQNPKGMRRAICVKDEDYRLSFLHGSFVTLTNMKPGELERIAEQRLSPLYVSVHSTNPATRRSLLRPRVTHDILRLIDYLLDHGIVLHTQVVLCPGENDGDDLEMTLRDLSERWPGVRSLAIVPVGLTDHREGLPGLTPVTVDDARRLAEQIEPHQKKFRSKNGVAFVYLADEIYRLFGKDPPPEEEYDGFPQIENGIGMTRRFLDTLRKSPKLFSNRAHEIPRAVTLVTGELFEPILRREVEQTLSRTKEGVDVQVVGCINRFFGRSVTVAGLLAGSDIEKGLEGVDLGERVYIPPTTLNDDGLFLDDMTPDQLESRLGVPVDAELFQQ